MTIESRRLDSWKEIAEHLGRDVRTAIRWEHERGLPVHRVPGERRGVVFAYPSEIDDWRSGHVSQQNGTTLPGAGSVSGASGGSAASVGGPPISGAAATAPYAAGSPRPRALPLRSLLVGLAVIGAFGVGAAALVRSRGPVSSARRIARINYGAHEIQAFNDAGQPLWRHAFEASVGADMLVGRPSPRYAVVDLDGDGASELVTTVSRMVTPQVAQDELYCFSEAGAVRWRVQLDDVVSFRGGTFGPPWSDGHVVSFRAGGETRIGWSQNSARYWPSLVTVLDGTGRRLATFVHSGSTYALSAFDGPDGPVILGGGVSNSSRAAALFVLDGRAVAGHSIEPAGSAYECLKCPSGRPLRYLLFPPSELNSAVSLPYNNVLQIRPGPAGIEVDTMEGLQPPSPAADQSFVFSHDFALQRASQSDSWPLHEQLEREGKLDHSVADCPMYRTPPPVRAWDPVNGWRDLKPRDPSVVTVGPRAGNP